MSSIERLKEEIEKTETILKESQEYFKKNPNEYSAQLLLLSTENHLSDLLKQLDVLQQNKER